jgi:hypothetical protein
MHLQRVAINIVISTIKLSFLSHLLQGSTVHLIHVNLQRSQQKKPAACSSYLSFVYVAKSNWGNFWDFFLFVQYSTLLRLLPLRFHCVGRRTLGSNPGLLRLRHWQSEALTTRLDLIHSRLDLIHSRLDLIHDQARSHPHR